MEKPVTEVNHLAHLFLADDTVDSILGNLSGDFVRGRIERQPEHLREGIVRHRKVDAFTDSHPAVIASKRRLYPQFGHYAPVIVDIFYDHLLARSFHHYRAETLDDFTGRMYRILGENQGRMPEVMRRVTQRMAAENWLTSYATLEGITLALRHISTRLSRPCALETSVPLLQKHFSEFDGEFHAFFPEVMALVGKT